MLDRDVLMLSGKFSKIWKQAEEIARCTLRSLLLDRLEAGFSYSSVGLRLTWRFLPGRDVNHFFPVEETTPEGMVHRTVRHKLVLFLT